MDDLINTIRNVFRNSTPAELISDAVGVACLFGIGYGLTLLAFVFGG